MYGTSGLKDLFVRFRDAHSLPLSPKTMIRKAVKAAKRDARDWGDDQKKEAPNSFDISISVNDWMDYYQIHNEETADRIAKGIEKGLRKGAFALKNATIVTIRPDSSIGFGDVRVIPSFRNQDSLVVDSSDEGLRDESNPGEEGETAKEAPSSRAGLASQEESSPDEQADPGRTEHGAKTGAPQLVTPVQPKRPEFSPLRTAVIKRDNEEAFLVGGERLYRLNPGSVVGVIRRIEDRVIPDIALPSKDFSAVSQDQGVFFCRKGEWHFRHNGRNATEIVTNGHRTSLTLKGDECKLIGGSIMTFAEGTPLMFVADAADLRSVSSVA